MPDIEQALVALADDIVFPATPHLAEAVVNQLPSRLPKVSTRSSGPRRWVLVTVAAAVLAIVLLGLPGPRAAIADLLGIGTVKVTLVDTLPAADLVSEPLGVEVSLSEAESETSFSIPTLGNDPDAVFIDRSIPGTVVTLVYDTPHGLPSLTITQLEATTHDALMQKLLGPDTDVTVVASDYGLAYWIEGGPHIVIMIDRDGQPHEDKARLSGNTLVYVHDGVTVRIEGNINLEQALDIANDLASQ